MGDLAKEIEECFESTNLYEILNVSKKASSSEIRKAYYKLSVQTHPDKVSAEGRAEATRRFQVLGKIYSILSEAGTRGLYDETGSLATEETGAGGEKDWMGYWRLVFPSISKKDIADFEKSYKGSEEEKKDLIEAYKEHKGGMEGITSTMLCCSVLEDEERYRGVLEGLIEEGVLEQENAFSQEPAKKKKARMAKAEKEKKEFEKMNGEAGEGGLVGMLMRKRKGREEFLDELAVKYGGKKGKAAGGKKKVGGGKKDETMEEDGVKNGKEDKKIEEKVTKAAKKAPTETKKAPTETKKAPTETKKAPTDEEEVLNKENKRKVRGDKTDIKVSEAEAVIKKARVAKTAAPKEGEVSKTRMRGTKGSSKEAVEEVVEKAAKRNAPKRK